MLHRDIKPDNIIRKTISGQKQQGDWKICDYGLSKILPKDMHETSVRAFTKKIGTPYYMSP